MAIIALNEILCTPAKARGPERHDKLKLIGHQTNITSTCASEGLMRLAQLAWSIPFVGHFSLA